MNTRMLLTCRVAFCSDASCSDAKRFPEYVLHRHIKNAITAFIPTLVCSMNRCRICFLSSFNMRSNLKHRGTLRVATGSNAVDVMEFSLTEPRHVRAKVPAWSKNAKNGFRLTLSEAPMRNPRV